MRSRSKKLTGTTIRPILRVQCLTSSGKSGSGLTLLRETRRRQTTRAGVNPGVGHSATSPLLPQSTSRKIKQTRLKGINLPWSTTPRATKLLCSETKRTIIRTPQPWAKEARISIKHLLFRRDCLEITLSRTLSTSISKEKAVLALAKEKTRIKTTAAILRMANYQAQWQASKDRSSILRAKSHRRRKASHGSLPSRVLAKPSPLQLLPCCPS